MGRKKNMVYQHVDSCNETYLKGQFLIANEVTDQTDWFIG